MASSLSRVSLLGSICLLIQGGAQAATPTATTVEYGRYRTKVVALTPAENVSGSVTVQAEEIGHIETTTRIPARVGEVFGYRVAYKNLPRYREHRFRTEVHHPPIKQPGGEIITKAIQETVMEPGSVPDGLHLWHFLKGFEYELVPGDWTMKEFIDDKEVVSITFEVVRQSPNAR